MNLTEEGPRCDETSMPVTKNGKPLYVWICTKIVPWGQRGHDGPHSWEEPEGAKSE